MSDTSAPSPAPKKSGRKIAMLVCGLFFFAGAGAATIGGIAVAKGVASKSWPESTGVITRAEMTVHSGNKGGSTYGASIRYDYVAPSGKKMTGERVSYGEYSSSDPAHAREVLGKYRPGTRVSVYVSPSDETATVLEPGVGAHLFIPLVLGLVFFVGGGVGFVRAAQGKFGQRHPDHAPARDADGSAPAAPSPAEHKRLIVTQDFSGITLSPRHVNKIGLFILAVGIVQSVVLNLMPDVPLPIRFMGIPVTLLGLVLLNLRTRIRIGAHDVGLFLGLGNLGYRKSVPRVGAMRVSLAPRGAKVNNVPVDAVVVANGAGEEFSFGNFYPADLKNAVASRLAYELSANRTEPAEESAPAGVVAENPFA